MTHTTKKTSAAQDFIEEHWLWLVIGAVFAGVLLFAVIDNRNTTTREDLRRRFKSAIVRYDQLKYDSEANREAIADCIFDRGELTSYRNMAWQKYYDDSDHFISVTEKPPYEDFYDGFEKFVEGDNSALMREEKQLLTDEINFCRDYIKNK